MAKKDNKEVKTKQTNTEQTNTTETPKEPSELAKLFNNIGQWVGKNPLPAAGYGIGGLMNLGGLTDNSELGGQLIGAGLGAFAPDVIGIEADPQLRALLGLGGGAIGSLFDKLRADQKAKEEQRQMYSAYNRY